MIPLDKLRAVKHLVTHANCPDGVASALIVKDALPDVRVSFVKYNGEEHRNLEPAPGMLFCDFSPYVVRSKQADGVERLDGNAMARWVEAGTIVLDHHTRDIIENFALNGLGVFGENEKLECGAWLAYEHVWLPTYVDEGGKEGDSVASETAAFAQRAAVRDTWKSSDPRFEQARREGELMLFWALSRPIDYYFELEYSAERNVLAKRLFERAEEHARKGIAESRRFTSAKGTCVLMFQGVAATSDAAEVLEQDEKAASAEHDEAREKLSQTWNKPVLAGPFQHTDLVVGFHYRVEKGKLVLQFSTRSHTGLDCQALAQAHGGNGHKAAAGFTLTEGLTGNPYETFKNVLDWWERGR